ncbi:MAG: cation:proton antiporter [Anaerolineales bacterium]|nr:cation:proton antiporter [Anaerolineales bacterium]
MTPFLQLSLALAIIVATAKVGGYLSQRLGQPSVLGELLVGVILGPTVLDVLHIFYFTDKHLVEVIHELAEIGVLLLMFIAGLELHLADLAKSGKVAALAGVLGVLFPVVLGAGGGLLFIQDRTEALFLGLILAATSVSISAQTLMELKVLRSRVGISMLGAAVFDDILVVLGLSVFSAVIISASESGLGDVLFIILRMALYLAIAAALGFWLLPKLSQKVYRLPISQGLVAFVVVVVLIYGWTAEELGHMAAITGAFLAGLLLARSTGAVKERIENGVSALAYGLFVPIFFINVGLSTNGRELIGDTFWFFVVLSVVAVISKVAGAGLGALLGGLPRREALQLGVGMMSRGEVGLIVASVGVAEGVIPASTFSVVVGVVIVTTLLTPPLLRMSFQEPGRAKGARSTAALPEN